MAKDTPTKPTTTTNASDEEVKFLLSIIKVAGVGAIDWQLVANANNIVSKAAASKRFSRLNVKYKDALADVKDAAAGKAGADGSASPKKGRGTKVTPKKRKVDEVEEDDDEEGAKAEVKGEGDGRMRIDVVVRLAELSGWAVCVGALSMFSPRWLL